MICNLEELKRLLPEELCRRMDRLCTGDLEEIRLRLGSRTEFVTASGSLLEGNPVREQDLAQIVHAATRYSPWAAESIRQGYLTIPGGHRLGLAGEAVLREGKMDGIRNVTSLCIRIAKDFPGISRKIGPVSGSLLILGPPGSGKTTMLRDLIREYSREGAVSVVDERGELFPRDFSRGLRCDVMTGCRKGEGIACMLRTMGPSCIAMDEITEEPDCRALLAAAGCGVRIYATAHAGSRQEFLTRPVYRTLAESGMFSELLILSRDKSWHRERMNEGWENGWVRS